MGSTLNIPPERRRIPELRERERERRAREREKERETERERKREGGREKK